MLSELSMGEFLERTASGSPVPGGGSVAALSAALAASLSEMVAHLTIGRKGYEAVDREMGEIAGEALRCRERLTGDIDRDSGAYNNVLAAYRLPRNTEKEKEERKQAIQSALKNAARVPLEVAGDALRIMDLAGEVLRKGNRNAVTDAAVAVMLARTAVLSALYNVKINLGSIIDEAFVKEVGEQAALMEQEAVRKETELLSQVNL